MLEILPDVGESRFLVKKLLCRGCFFQQMKVMQYRGIDDMMPFFFSFLLFLFDCQKVYGEGCSVFFC